MHGVQEAGGVAPPPAAGDQRTSSASSHQLQFFFPPSPILGEWRGSPAAQRLRCSSSVARLVPSFLSVSDTGCFGTPSYQAGRVWGGIFLEEEAVDRERGCRLLHPPHSLGGSLVSVPLFFLEVSHGVVLEKVYQI